MANIYKHKENGKLYTIEQLVVDMKFADCGSRTGIYAYPYRWDGESIEYTKGQHIRNSTIHEYNPKKFVSDNFEIAGEIW